MLSFLINTIAIICLGKLKSYKKLHSPCSNFSFSCSFPSKTFFVYFPLERNSAPVNAHSACARITLFFDVSSVFWSRGTMLILWEFFDVFSPHTDELWDFSLSVPRALKVSIFPTVHLLYFSISVILL
uniref:Uncharacterized protein n=1 Tax=Cacopsylla melanoneura TaxID=428564 RepID=A0A8D8U9U0_9HEMI